MRKRRIEQSAYLMRGMDVKNTRIRVEHWVFGVLPSSHVKSIAPQRNQTGGVLCQVVFGATPLVRKVRFFYSVFPPLFFDFFFSFLLRAFATILFLEPASTLGYFQFSSLVQRDPLVYPELNLLKITVIGVPPNDY